MAAAWFSTFFEKAFVTRVNRRIKPMTHQEAYRRDVPDARVHLLDAGHFALDTAADEIAALVRGFVDSES
jgi:pimeloyl-ACP methyl ester carboxylesterase